MKICCPCRVPVTTFLIITFSVTAVWLTAAGVQRKRNSIEAAAEKKLAEFIEKFEKEKSLQPFQRISTIHLFGTAPCKKTVKFLDGLFQTEDNPAIHQAICHALGQVGSLEAIRAMLTTGLSKLAEHPENQQLLEAIREALQRPLDSKSERWILQNGMKLPAVRRHKSAKVLLLKAIAELRSDKRFRVLSSELKRITDPELQAVVLKSIPPSAAEEFARLAEAFAKSQHRDVRVAAYYILLDSGSPKYRRLFARGLKDTAWEIRTLSMDGLALLKDRRIVEHASQMLDDPDKRVQLAAVQALVDHGDEEVIEILFKALDKTSGRVQDDIADALARLSGKNFGIASGNWESWWRVARKKNVEIRKRTAEEFAAIKDADQNASTLVYHGLRVLSNYVTFIIDCSESMENEFDPKERKSAGKGKSLRRGRTKVVKKGGKKKGEKSDPPEIRRIDEAKKELLGVVKKLKAGKAFNILRFNTFVEDFQNEPVLGGAGRPIPGAGPAAEGERPPPTGGLRADRSLVEMTEKVRAHAITFVESSKPQGLTNLSRTLETAFTYGDLDTIYLLSDGAPTVGITNNEELLASVRRWNRLRKVKINTIGFGLEAKQKEFLRRLSDENFGVFVER